MVAAAADLNFAMQDIARGFRGQHPEVELQVAYGSSGNYFAQIQSGAPFDMFLSADVEYPRKLVALGIGAENSIFTYAVGRLVVWVPAKSPLDPATALRDPALKHIAIANPQHAPYGRSAEAGVVALSLALAPAMRGQGRYWEIPLDAYPRMEQGGMILKDSSAARELRTYLLSEGGRRILKQYGFYSPNE
jgi:molybdate transport system substrate-binding protein